MWIRHMFSRHNRALAVLMLLMTCNMVMAVEAQITLNNGKVIRGEFVSKNKDTIILKVVGIDTRYDNANIKSFKRILTLDQEYQAKREQLKDDDLEGRYQLASWLYSEKKAYNQAEKELLSLQKMFPKDTRVPLLLKIVHNKQTLQGNDSAKARDKTTRIKTTPAKAPIKTRARPHATPAGKTYQSTVIPMPSELLTEDQINLLKVYEVNLNLEPKIIFKRTDLSDFLKSFIGMDGVPQNKSDRNYFLNKLDGYQQLDVIFKAKAREFYSKARVLGDPQVFKAFKTIHRTYILNRCATSACHGGKEARGIFLFNRRPGAHPDDVVYTNFYILNSYAASKSGKQYDMIDRVAPDRSLLLQFGMRAEDSVFPHPPIRNMQPAFLKGQDDAQYRMIRNWIQSLYAPTPEYGINYAVPRSTKQVVSPVETN